MTSKTWIVFAAIVIVLIGGLVYMSKDSKIDVSDVDPFSIQGPSDQNGQIGDRIIGKADSKVIVYEYGDYQCPGCAQVAPTVKAVADKYKDKIAFVFRNFPIPGHPNARAAAASAESAGLQGKFWEMHDVIYANQTAWQNQNTTDRTETFVSYATNLGLKNDQFKKDLVSEAITKKIDFDYALGKKAKVTGTPAFFVNDELANVFVKDGKKVTANTPEAVPAYQNVDTFYEFLLKPAMQKAGISTDDK